jgi:hypothetical protein
MADNPLILVPSEVFLEKALDDQALLAALREALIQKDEPS